MKGFTIWDDQGDIKTRVFLSILVAVCVFCLLVAMVYAVQDTVTINVGVAESYESYTKAVPCLCDVLVEKRQGVIVNMTVIEFIYNESSVVWE